MKSWTWLSAMWLSWRTVLLPMENGKNSLSNLNIYKYYGTRICIPSKERNTTNARVMCVVRHFFLPKYHERIYYIIGTFILFSLPKS